jgi:Flp pilus assembly pilin Flp
MENASKALIIAGAVLISIVIVTIGVMLVNGGTGLFNQGGEMMAQQEIDAFNSTFTAYEGRQTGSQARALLTKIATHNSTNVDDASKQVNVSINKGTDILVVQNNLSTNKKLIETGKAYEISFEYSDSNLVNKINIDEK